MMGGCTGGDIRREGEDCQDAWWADLSGVDPTEGTAGWGVLLV
jgi:hypothetical protein